MDALVGRHGLGCVGILVVGRARLGALGESQHEQRPEVPRQEGEESGAQIALERLAEVIAEQLDPVLLVTPLGVGEPHQDLALGTLLALGQLVVDGGFGAFIRQILPPALDARLAADRLRGRPLGGLRTLGNGRRHGCLRSDGSGRRSRSPDSAMRPPGGAPGRRRGGQHVDVSAGNYSPSLRSA